MQQVGRAAQEDRTTGISSKTPIAGLATEIHFYKSGNAKIAKPFAER